MEELKIQYREYYWKYGVSPFKEDHQKQEPQKQGGGVGVLQRENEESGANIEVIGENNTNVSDLKSNHRSFTSLVVTLSKGFILLYLFR
ncbi:hypothetical protein OIU85_006984 [Salix viminalis]|uniref:Uncharacterized protein n=1 Tax=Salix viminalis TaxID=40686 RepID=A0A9Q0P7U2_SALVM|nr:hypothetical protein OIU85_006984 [Salix viminalis]